MIPPGGAVHRFILETFAKTGHSPTLEDIRQVFAPLSSVEVADSLVAELERRGSVHRNAGDREVTHAYPFSNEPTPHKVQLADGPQVYAMCAIDALGMPFMLKKDAEIYSACTQCRGEIQIQFQSGHIRQERPKGIVVWFPAMKEKCLAATDLCPAVNFFCSAVHLGQWRAGHPVQSGQRLTLLQALEHGRKTFEPLLQEGMKEGADA
ncbi:MAG: alkylmercury lyase family protein [Candidatus Binatia bacterium]